MYLVRTACIGLSAFIAITAIGGGLAILTKVDEFPQEWLQRTPFTSYIIPAMILTVMVGGSTLITTILTIQDNKNYPLSVILSGLILIGFIIGEIILLKQDPHRRPPSRFFIYA